MTDGGTQILQMRFNPSGKTYPLHPEDQDVEHYLKTNGGKAVVKAIFLLARDRVSLDTRALRKYHPVND